MTVRLAELPDINALEVPDAAASPAPSGKPLLLPCELIDEDPDQPRTAFDDESLRELAATIAERGVRQPVSVRRHPSIEGRWMLNFGARRLRASKLAGKAEIPAFVDEAFDNYDQVIENEQRKSLEPLELALFVEQRLKLGETLAEIARRLGKSRSYLTFVTALIDAPDWLMQIYREGRCKGALELYELRRLAEVDQQSVDRLLGSEDGRVARASILAAKRAALAACANVVARVPRRRETSAPAGPSSGATTPPGCDAACQGQLMLLGRVDAQEVEIDLRRTPESWSQVFVRPTGSGSQHAVDLDKVQELRLIRDAGRPDHGRS